MLRFGLCYKSSPSSFQAPTRHPISPSSSAHQANTHPQMPGRSKNSLFFFLQPPHTFPGSLPNQHNHPRCPHAKSRTHAPHRGSASPSPELLQNTGSSTEMGSHPPEAAAAPGSADGAAQGARAAPAAAPLPPHSRIPPGAAGGRPAAALPSPGRLSGLQGMAREEHLPACPPEPRRRRGALRLSPLNSPPRVPPPPPASPWEWEWGNGNKPAALGESKRDSPSCRRCPTPSSRPAARSVAGMGGTGRLSPRRNVQEVAPGWLRAPSAAGSV